MSAWVLGIDLGTTNTAAVAFGEDEPYPVSILHGRDHAVLPSVVSLKSPQAPLVGWLARDMTLTDPKTTIHGWKRFIGRSERSDYVSRHRHRFPFQLGSAPGGELGVVVKGQVFRLVDIAALILDQVRLQASAALQTDVRQCVITVPAHFMNRQRVAVLEAAAKARLEVLGLVNEPTAAALAFGMDQNLHTRVLVVDLGGGTFDATILELTDNIFEVCATQGHGFLGGADFDHAIADRLLEVCWSTHRIEPNGDPVVKQRILNAAEAAKMALSQTERHRLRVPMVGSNRDGRIVDLEYTMKRRELEDLVAPLVERCIGIVEEMMSTAGLTAKDIDYVITVGGQTQMPLIRRRIRDVLGMEPLTHLDPETAIAHGAALVARSEGDLAGAVLLDVLSVPIGIIFPGGGTRWLFESHTRLPATRRIDLQAPRDGRPLSVGVWQGPDVASTERQVLGVVHIPNELFGSGNRFALECVLKDDMQMNVRFISNTRKVALNIEPPARI